jgi:MinD superfamily P-loop ATPase
MVISVASGKGGTGKTTVAVNLALSVEGGPVQFLDCDVEEPNAHIFLKPEIAETRKVFIPVPEVDESKCSFCGKCREVCAYNAIAVIKPAEAVCGNVLVFSVLCHGCGSCAYFCPERAIKEVQREVGTVETGSAGRMRFVHGMLNIGEAMAPPVIREIKKFIDPSSTVIIDAPPGTSCPVVETVKNSDFCVLVTEPTPFGLNDLVLAVEVLRKVNVPFGVVINRSDLGNKKTDEYCEKENISVLMRIPFRKDFAAAYSRGETLVEAFPDIGEEFKKLYGKITDGK